MSESNDAEFGLVMPFITVASKGGPHHDLSYVAGYEIGLMDARLAAAGEWVHECRFTIRAVSLGQADLLAMRHGFLVAESRTLDEAPEWAEVILIRQYES